MRPWRAMVLVVLVGASAMGAAPASQPGETPVESDKPKAALMSFAIALDAGDGATLRRLLDVTTPTEQKIADATIHMAVALADLNASLRSQFGDQAARTVIGDGADQLKQNLAAIAAAKETVNGDTAIISIAPTTQGTKTLKLVHGEWKISLAQQAKGLATQRVDQVAAMVGKELKQLKEVTTEIRAGKFATATDAANALHERLGNPPATMPSSQPAREASTTGPSAQE